MNRKQKYDLLEKLTCKNNDTLSEAEKDAVSELASSREIFFRSMAARALADIGGEFVTDLLILLSSDKNSLVRTEAVDSLGYHPSEKVLELLINKAQNDPYYLVRAYSVSSAYRVSASLGISSDRVRSLAEQLLKKERYVICKVFCLEAMYLCGDDAALAKMITLFDAAAYNGKCAVLNVLTDILNEDNKDIIESFASGVEKTTLAPSVRESFDNLTDALYAM